MFWTKSGTAIASDCVRVVHGGRGDYREFSRDQIFWENTFVPDDQKYRLDPLCQDKLFYIEHRTNDDSFVKIYEQLKEVGYADYIPGMCYIAPSDLIFVDEFIDEAD